MPLVPILYFVARKNLPTMFRSLDSSVFLFAHVLGIHLLGLSIPVVRLLMGKTAWLAYVLAIAGMMGSVLWLDLPSVLRDDAMGTSWPVFRGYLFRPWFIAMAIWIVSICIEAGYTRKWHWLISVLGVVVVIPILVVALGDFIQAVNVFPFFVGLPPLWLLAVAGWAYTMSIRSVTDADLHSSSWGNDSDRSYNA